MNRPIGLAVRFGGVGPVHSRSSHREFSAISRLQLAHDMSDMHFHGAYGQIELLGYDLIGFAELKSLEARSSRAE